MVDAITKLCQFYTDQYGMVFSHSLSNPRQNTTTSKQSESEG